MIFAVFLHTWCFNLFYGTRLRKLQTKDLLLFRLFMFWWRSRHSSKFWVWSGFIPNMHFSSGLSRKLEVIWRSLSSLLSWSMGYLPSSGEYWWLERKTQLNFGDLFIGCSCLYATQSLTSKTITSCRLNKLTSRAQMDSNCIWSGFCGWRMFWFVWSSCSSC